ncbi:MAG: hypothetical protein IT579_19050 [Verrucomicrobia subdivision 3 bacterium]|nr:hypothetical protein [Limisphaerales bacterium]
MKVLLQDMESGFFFKAVGVTTRDTRSAMDFLSSSRAIDFCATQKLNGMQIVLRFDEQHYDIVLPMVMERLHHHGPPTQVR